MYRFVPHRPWWKFWDPSKMVQRATPDSAGAYFNEKGEFVGDWETLAHTKLGAFRVAQGADGGHQIYTIDQRRNGTDVFRDGRRVAAFQGSVAELKVHADNKVYARFALPKEDLIATVDPATQERMDIARIPAHIHTWTHRHSQQGYTDSKGIYHVTRPARRHEHNDRYGVTQFEVGADSRVYYLFRGNLMADGPEPRELAKRVDRFLPMREGFYAVREGKLGNRGQAGSVDWRGSEPITADAQDNLYKSKGSVMRRYRLSPESL